MNQTEILNMKPGTELDNIVAVEVMGYIWLKHLLQFSAELAVKWLGTPSDLAESRGMYVVVPLNQFMALKERENYAEAVLPFSTEMGPAEQVICRMEELGYDYHLETKLKQSPYLYYAYFNKIGIQSKKQLVGANKMPEVVVKAALSALAAS